MELGETGGRGEDTYIVTLDEAADPYKNRFVGSGKEVKTNQIIDL